MMTLTNKVQWLATQSESNKIAFGGFLTSLLRAYGRADSNNRARIELAWQDDIEREFDMWYNRID
jgi:hypothetical protein